MSFLNYINESNKLTLNKPADTDRIYYSELNEWFTTNAFRNFSIKYVVEGQINYKTSNKTFDVKTGSYLLANRQPFVNAYFESQKPTKSICIDIHPETIAEAFTIISSNKDHELDNYMAGYFTSPDFFENVVPASHSMISNELENLTDALKNNSAYITDEWFLNLAEKIILQEFPKYNSIKQINAKKNSTKKEIFERVVAGKFFMDENFIDNPGINKIASACNLSTFHFFRSFKQAFKISPHKYMLNKRLDLALQLLQQDDKRISDIASMISFPDSCTFSKAFKRKFGTSPKNLR